MSLTVHKVDAHNAIFSFHNVFVWQNRGKPVVADFDYVHDLQRELLAHYPDGTAFLLRVRAGSPLPDMDARARATEMFRDLAPHMHTCVATFEGRGFWASAARAIMAGITAVMRGKFPVKVFGEVRDSVPFVTEVMQSHGARFTAEELQSVLDEYWDEMNAMAGGESETWR